MDITKDLLEPLRLLAVRANSDWIVIRRKGYFDVFLEDEPFTSVEVLWNRSQDMVLARVWGKTIHKTNNANLAKICKRVFSRKPCFGIWKQDLRSDFLERLKPCNFPVLRFKSVSCVEWVDSENDLLLESTSDPVTCMRCKEDAAQEGSLVIKDPAFFVETEFESLSTRGDHLAIIHSEVKKQNGEQKEGETDVKMETEDNEGLDEVREDNNDEDDDGGGESEFYDTNNLQDDISLTDDGHEESQCGNNKDIVTYDIKIESIFMKERPKRKKPKWQTDKGENMFEMKNWMPFFFPNDDMPICPFCNARKANQNIVRKHVKERHAFSWYKCPLCKYYENLPNHIVEHVEKNHTDDPTLHMHKYECACCKNKISSDSNIFIAHASKCFIEYRKNIDKTNLLKIKEDDIKKYREMMERKHPRNDSVRKSEKAYRKRKKKQVFEEPRPCKECGKMFERWFSLNEHMKIHQKFDVPQQCPNCDKMFEFKNAFLQHKKWHRRGEWFKCTRCDYKAHSRKGYENHEAKHLVEEGVIDKVTCPECNKQYNTEWNLEKHMEYAHKDVDYKCSKCDLIFPNTYERSEHLAKVHNKKMFNCEPCLSIHNKQVMFHTKQRLSIHNKQVHKTAEEREAEKVNCSLCNKVLATRATLTYHMKTKHPESGNTSNPVACDVCDRIFYNNRSLYFHKKNSHKTEEEKEAQRVKCNVCEQMLSTKAAHRYHMQHRHPFQWEKGVRENIFKVHSASSWYIPKDIKDVG